MLLYTLNVHDLISITYFVKLIGLLNIFQIFSWLVSTAESFLHDNISMGTNLAEAREFLESHKSLHRDLRVRIFENKFKNAN